jgi:PAS domain-containing protein
VGILICDGAGNVLHANEQAASILRTSHEAMVGTNVGAWLPVETPGEARPDAVVTLRSGRGLACDGGAVPVSYTVEAMAGPRSALLVVSFRVLADDRGPRTG